MFIQLLFRSTSVGLYLIFLLANRVDFFRQLWSALFAKALKRVYMRLKVNPYQLTSEEEKVIGVLAGAGNQYSTV